MSPTSPSPDVRGLLRERLDTLLDECNQVMDNADYGQTIHDLDDFILPCAAIIAIASTVKPTRILSRQLLDWTRVTPTD